MFYQKFELVPGDMVRIREGEQALVISCPFLATIEVEIKDDLICPFVAEAKMPRV